jgi:hypothetical protein
MPLKQIDEVLRRVGRVSDGIKLPHLRRSDTSTFLYHIAVPHPSLVFRDGWDSNPSKTPANPRVKPLDTKKSS